MRRARVFLGLVAVAAAITPVTAVQAAPVASSTHEPENPLTHEPVQFISTATTDPGATIVSEVWDLDDDGEYDDASGPIATFAFVRPGARRVVLRVVDSAGHQDSLSHRLVIGNRAPTASFFFAPGQPSPGERTTVFSTSSDPDGFIVNSAWDLDRDGDFDDATGDQATVTFPEYGKYEIGLRVSDDNGASSTVVLPINVTLPIQVRSLRLMSPFPIVRVSGIVRKGGMKLRVLSVKAPVGASVNVRCRGRGCPFRRRSRTVMAAALSPATGLVRIRRFGRRLLRVGATLRIYVTRPGEIGKYTLLRVRRGKLPVRSDSCVLLAGEMPVSCPPG